jgi:hypothetical protein
MWRHIYIKSIIRLIHFTDDPLVGHGNT